MIDGNLGLFIWMDWFLAQSIGINFFKLGRFAQVSILLYIPTFIAFRKDFPFSYYLLGAKYQINFYKFSSIIEVPSLSH